MVKQAGECETSYLGRARTTHLCKSALLQTHQQSAYRMQVKSHGLLDSIVQEPVAPQASFKMPDIQTICILEPVYTRNLDRKADFVAHTCAVSL